MGFFDFLKGKNKDDKNSTPSTKPTAKVEKAVKTESGKQVSNAAAAKIRLSKRTKTVSKLCLTKGITSETKARVVLVLDYSYSMSGEYDNGTVQEIVERILPIGFRFDDDDAIDVYLFSDGEGGVHEVGDANKKNFSGYVNNNITGKYVMGGTDYSYVMKDITKKYAKTEGDPVFVIFITDGDCYHSDRDRTTEAIIDASKHGIFWQFVGVGSASMGYLEKLDDMEGRTVDNANFFQIPNINKTTDESLYGSLMNEFPLWLKEAKTKKIIK